MSEKLVYLSKEWCEEAKKRISAELTPEKMNGLTASMTDIYLNCPDGKTRFFYMKCVDGALTELTTGEGTGPKDSEFLITGEYKTFAQITRAELGAQLALMTGKLKLTGNLVKALKLAKVSDRLNKVMSTIPTEF